jgi:hypothetical protein
MRIRIRSRIKLINFDANPHFFDADANPNADPGYQNDKDPCGSGSTTLKCFLTKSRIKKGVPEILHLLLLLLLPLLPHVVKQVRQVQLLPLHLHRLQKDAELKDS